MDRRGGENLRRVQPLGFDIAGEDLGVLPPLGGRNGFRLVEQRRGAAQRDGAGQGLAVVGAGEGDDVVSARAFHLERAVLAMGEQARMLATNGEQLPGQRQLRVCAGAEQLTPAGIIDRAPVVRVDQAVILQLSPLIGVGHAGDGQFQADLGQ